MIQTHFREDGLLENVGDWKFAINPKVPAERYFVIILPEPANKCAFPIHDGQWKWNQSLDKPSIHPSINVIGLWHGWIIDGFIRKE